MNIRNLLQVLLLSSISTHMGALLAEEKTFFAEGEADEISRDAYIYGYPLVMMEMTRRVRTNVAEPFHGKAPMGQFAFMRYYPTADFDESATPTTDVLYAETWLDLSNEPYVLSLPADADRYYLMPILSGWGDVVQSLGTRTTGTAAQKYVITGPFWKGVLPAGLTEIKSPTNLVCISGKIYCSGTKEDYKAVHALQDRYAVVPLSSYGKAYEAPLAVVDSTVDMQTPVRRQVEEMDLEEYFCTLAELLKANPPTAADAALLTRMAKIGIIPGADFDLALLGDSVAYDVENGQELALHAIRSAASTMGVKTDGWQLSLDLGTYGNDYLKRAAAAAIHLGANLPQDMITSIAREDGKGTLLNGANQYVIHFERGQTPPVKGFWSLTLYTDDSHFYPNVLDRYTLSPRHPFKYNRDGSLDLYVQYENPGQDKESNWLPAPEEDFMLMLRLYWPDASAVKGKWTPPQIERVKMPFKRALRQRIIGHADDRIFDEEKEGIRADLTVALESVLFLAESIKKA